MHFNQAIILTSFFAGGILSFTAFAIESLELEVYCDYMPTKSFSLGDEVGETGTPEEPFEMSWLFHKYIAEAVGEDITMLPPRGLSLSEMLAGLEQFDYYFEGQLQFSTGSDIVVEEEALWRELLPPEPTKIPSSIDLASIVSGPDSGPNDLAAQQDQEHESDQEAEFSEDEEPQTN